MRAWVLGLTTAFVTAAAWAPGCATSDNSGTRPGTGGTGLDAGVGGIGGTGGISTDGASGGGGGLDPDAACALFSAEAKQAPAALLFVVDGSASMSDSQKWGTAQLATIKAIDSDSFDNTALGLVRFPATFVSAPACLFGLIPTVACGVSFLPQVPLNDSGVEKSNQGGVRKQIYDYLAAPQNGPVTDPSDASPIYDAMVAGYSALEAYNIDQRVMVLITDGGFSCTSLSNPTRPGYSDGLCDDWEYPDTVNALITQKRTDANKPTYTFVIGVPGSNSVGQMQGSYATAPYAMLLALSSYAMSGSPTTVPSGCEGTFSKNGPPPGLPCHVDLSTAGTFNVDQLAAAIDSIRGKALGCLYDSAGPTRGTDHRHRQGQREDHRRRQRNDRPQAQQRGGRLCRGAMLGLQPEWPGRAHWQGLHRRQDGDQREGRRVRGLRHDHQVALATCR